MMFATLDDLEGSVEILVFGKALAEYEGALGVDSVVIVRGRVDHKDADKTCLVVQSVEPFEPTPEEIERRESAGRDAPRRARAAARAPRRGGACRPRSSTTSSTCWRTSPASREVVLEVQMSSGDPRTLQLGPSYKVAPTPTLRAELEHVLGPAALARRLTGRGAVRPSRRARRQYAAVTPRRA